MTKRKAVIIDLDGTLCNTEHRQHHLDQKPKNWKAFFEGLVDDQPHDWCYELIRGCSAVGHKIIFVSGRHKEWQEGTLRWLAQHVPDLRSFNIYMRDNGDSRDDTVVKAEIYHEHIEPQFDVLFCVDDRPKVVRMWRSLGLVCLQCQDKEF